MTAFQQTLYEFEKSHHRMKQSYEDEIIRLRRELEQRGIPIPKSDKPISAEKSDGPPGAPARSTPSYPALNAGAPDLQNKRHSLSVDPRYPSTMKSMPSGRPPMNMQRPEEYRPVNPPCTFFCALPSRSHAVFR